MRMLFGTDGIRGVAGDPPLDHMTVFAVGAALGRSLTHPAPTSDARVRHPADQGTRIVIGQDTRESSGWIAESLTGGLESAGAEVESAGVITTPAIAYLARGGFAAGVVISASHNPWTDNGIKIFGHDGYKLSDEREEKLEGDIFALLHGNELRSANPRPTNTALGGPPQSRDEGGAAANGAPQAAAPECNPELLRKYAAWLGENVRATRLSGVRALVDCANGAATPVAHEIFRACGVEAKFMHDRPNGRNINEKCGALYPQTVAGAVAVQRGTFDLGITFDGDADRALFSDNHGNVVNGDAILLVASRDMKSRGLLKGDTVVATTMSNMGLEIALRDSGIRMLRAAVGDKYVLEEMRKTGATLGGEQSGHIIFRDGDSTTGDGLLTALRVMEIMARTGKPLDELAKGLKVFPQTIKNVRVREKKPFEEFPEVMRAIRAAEEELHGNGRVVVRYSGTEALARVMVEAETEVKMRRITDNIAEEIGKALGIG
ncbi:MAG: phosphoglucosamine mutase [Terriglobales bacterium]